MIRAIQEQKWLKVRLWLEWTGLVAVLWLALELRTQRLETISFWFDEACSWKISQFLWHEMFDAISRDAHPPLYYIVLKSWMSVFGNSVYSARLLSVVCGLLTVLMTWVFMRVAVRILEKDYSTRFRPAPLMATFFVAVSPLHVELSLEARPYALGTLLSLVLATCAMRVLEKTSRWVSWVGFALTSVALSLTHYYGALTVAAIWLGCLVTVVTRTASDSENRRRLRWGFLGSAFAMVIAWVPWLSTFRFQLSRANRQLWFSDLDPDGLAGIFWKSLAGGKHSDIWAQWIWGPALVWGMVACLLMVLWMRNRQSSILLILCGMNFPLFVSIIYSLEVRTILSPKYLILAQLFFLLGLAFILDFTWSGWPMSGARPLTRKILAISQFLGLIAAASWLAFWCYDFTKRRDEIAKHPGVQGAMAYLNAHREPGELCIVGSPFVHTLANVYVDGPQNVKTMFIGNYRDSILSGPALRDSDCIEYEGILADDPAVIWTIDVERLFGRAFAYSPPQRYQLVSDESFKERFGYRLDIHIRCYVRARN